MTVHDEFRRTSPLRFIEALKTLSKLLRCPLEKRSNLFAGLRTLRDLEIDDTLIEQLREVARLNRDLPGKIAGCRRLVVRFVVQALFRQRANDSNKRAVFFVP